MKRLRVGVLLDSFEVSTWVRHVLEDLTASPACELAAAIVAESDGAPAPQPERLRYLAYYLYDRLDRRLMTEAPDPFARVDVEPLLRTAATLRVRPERRRVSDTILEPDLERIRALGLDVLLRFGFRILRGGILAAARFGVWSYHHDDNRRIRGGPPCFWEVVEGLPVTGSVLQVLTERLDGGRVIYRSSAPTHRRSVARNRGHVYWKSATFVRRCLERVAETGELPAEESYQPYSYPLYRKPGNARAAVVLGRFLTRAAREWAGERLTRAQWFLGYRFHDAGNGAGGDASAASAPEEAFRFARLVPPADRFWADPFPWHHDGRWFVFFEEYRFRARRGVLRVLEVDPVRGRVGEPQTVLEEPFHLSYPFIFSWQDELFLLPETSAAGEVRLYRCVEFPHRWRHEAVLLRGVRAVDPTLHEEAGRWWLFAGVAAAGARHAHDELHLFSADTPLGPFAPHRGNPVVSDARSARPAGRLFRWRDELLRPAQDCSGRYGSAVAIQRVARLDDLHYAEEPVSRIEATWAPGLLATHTWNRACGLTVTDGLRRIWRRPW